MVRAYSRHFFPSRPGVLWSARYSRTSLLASTSHAHHGPAEGQAADRFSLLLDLYARAAPAPLYKHSAKDFAVRLSRPPLLPAVVAALDSWRPGWPCVVGTRGPSPLGRYIVRRAKSPRPFRADGHS